MNLISQLFFRFRLLKLRKYSKWEKYLALVKEMSNTEIEPLLEKPTISLKEANVDEMFKPIFLHQELREKYNLLAIAGNGSDFEKAIRIMQWLTDNTFYSGASITWNADDALMILENSYQKGFKQAICCRDKAIALTDCLLAVGLKAYPICMLSANRKGCHFTVHCLLKETSSWILLDPSFNSYFKNGDKTLNIWETKQTFLNNTEPQIVGYSFNGTDCCKDIYVTHFLKQLMTNISTWENSSEKGRGYKKYDWSTRKVFETELPKEISFL